MAFGFGKKKSVKSEQKPTKKPRVSVVVTDVDNTLFDWFEVWYAGFNALLEQVAKESGVPVSQLKTEFKNAHQTYGTAEYAYALTELPSLKAKHPGADVTAIYAQALLESQRAAKEALKPYEGVIETLRELKKRKCLIIAYTETMPLYSIPRLKRLGLDGLLDYLYTPSNHKIPTTLSEEQTARCAPSAGRLERTVHRLTPPGEVKPNPELLLDILRDAGAVPEEAIYVGDSAIKDVAMAQQAGVTDVWAEYGKAQNRAGYELLREVTHWTAALVEREKLNLDPATKNYVLDSGFKQLFDLFEFEAYVPAHRDAKSDEVKLALEAWKQTVTVQEHFNDIELRLRSAAITLLTAIIAASGFALKEKLRAEVLGVSVSLGSWILFAGLIAWIAFYAMERFWYHPLLYGAVKHSAFIEKRLRLVLPELALSGAISRESSAKVPPIAFFRRVLWSPPGSRSPVKMDAFYGTVAVVILLLMLGTCFSPSSTRPEKVAGRAATAEDTLGTDTSKGIWIRIPDQAMLRAGPNTGLAASTLTSGPTVKGRTDTRRK